MLHIQTPVVNNPTFIELQHKTLKFFVQGDYDFTVYNDAKDWPDYSNFGNGELRREIQRTCERLNIPCINLNHPHHHHETNASVRTADTNNDMLDDQRTARGNYLVLDSDMFPIYPFQTNIYGKYDAAFVPQQREHGGKVLDYFWNGIYYFNIDVLEPQDVMNWAAGPHDGVWTDTGGGMYKFLRESKNNFYKIPHLVSCQWSIRDYPIHLDFKWLEYIQNDPRNTKDAFFSEIYDDIFFHFRAGGNWEMRPEPEYKGRTQRLCDVVNAICRG